ncbi:MAG: hypothetical protein V1799_07390 [bacterium]
MQYEALKIAGILVTIFLGVGSVIVGIVKSINGSKEESKKFAAEEITKESDERCLNDKSLQTAIERLATLHASDKVVVMERLAELDLWRKEINGSLKVISTHMEYSNKILSEQKVMVSALAVSQQQLAISIAEIRSVLRVSRIDGGVSE